MLVSLLNNAGAVCEVNIKLKQFEEKLGNSGLNLTQPYPTKLKICCLPCGFLLNIQLAKIFLPAVKSGALLNSISDLCQSFFLRHSSEKATRMGPDPLQIL